MSWLVNTGKSQSELAASLRAQLSSGSALLLPGAHDALSALVARQAGFEALYLSGAAFTASRGMPDLGIVNSAEMAARAAEIVRATALPLVVDIDTGYGSPLAAARAARELAEAGAAGVQIEDQRLPKVCGHLQVQALATVDEFLAVLSAVRIAAPELVCIARTDARNVEGLDAAIQRARAYRDAGADVIFPEALLDIHEFRAFREAVDGPLLANLTEFGRTDVHSLAELEAIGYAAVLFPVSSLRAAAFAYRTVYRTLREVGSTVSLLGQLLTRAELYELLEYERHEIYDGVAAPAEKTRQ
jgi:methylisocitrate lyase